MDGKLESGRRGETREFSSSSLFLAACLAVYISSLTPVQPDSFCFYGLSCNKAAPVTSVGPFGQFHFLGSGDTTASCCSSGPRVGSIFLLWLVSGLPQCPLSDFLAVPSPK